MPFRVRLADERTPMKITPVNYAALPGTVNRMSMHY